MKLKKRLSILKNKYRFILYNDSNYEPIWRMRLSGWTVLGIIIPALILLGVLLFLFISFTPVRNLIPGYPNGKMRAKIIYNAAKVDSLENAVAAWSNYFNSIQSIVTGNFIEEKTTESTSDSIVDTKIAEYKPTAADLMFREEMEHEREVASRLAVLQDDKSKISFGSVYLYLPLRGAVLKTFNAAEKHYSIDIKANDGDVVSAVLDGTIISSSWTLADAYVLQIQHDDNFISIYKGNSSLLKNVGDRVKVGEAIAVVGKTSGSEVIFKFELWHNGSPVDPETYINFK